MHRLFLLFVNLLLMGNISCAYSEEKEPEKFLNDWSAYLCYSVSGALDMQAFKNGEKLSKVSRDKGRLYTQVSKGDTATVEVSYFAGFPLKIKSKPVLTIDNVQKFLLYSHPEPKTSVDKSYAWSHPKDDKKLIDALKKGQKAVVESYSHTGKVIKDTFALSGFTASINFMKKKCK